MNMPPCRCGRKRTPTACRPTEGLNTGLAWLYVGLRVAHSLIQAIINVVMLRFAIFMAASFVLLVMSVRAALIVY
jgi:hypothetical protein